MSKKIGAVLQYQKNIKSEKLFCTNYNFFIVGMQCTLL
jgi:hypothetical protein